MFEHSRRSRKSQMSEINVVPYIDVMLVLLVIFMVTTPLLTQGVEVDLPEAVSNEVDNDIEPFLLVVDRNGQLSLNEEKQITAGEEVVRQARIVFKRSPKTPFLVKGDRHVEYQAVMNAMVLLQQAGVPKVGLVTEPPER
ncbi:MAG: protein TolR [Arenicellales bacterium]|jgi:biopolymer transport protein TolR